MLEGEAPPVGFFLPAFLAFCLVCVQGATVGEGVQVYRWLHRRANSFVFVLCVSGEAPWARVETGRAGQLPLPYLKRGLVLEPWPCPGALS